jgi:CheY-like chemotaxis protein
MSDKPVILVVDDDRPILILMQSILKEYGFQPVTAATGQQAIDAVRQQKPAVVLVDKNMPGMNGDQVIHLLRAEPGLDKLPILLLSGERLSRAELAKLGADGAVQKPFDVAALIDQIRQYV